MADSVGQIGLDLVVNRDGFDKQMKGITSLAKKAGVALAAAFAVKKIVDFGKASVSANMAVAESARQLEVTMRNATGATRAQIQEVKDLADAYEKVGVVASDIQLAGGQELATYVSNASSVKKMLPVLNDMVAQQYGFNATAESSVNIATMLGKVLNGQTAALSRYGYEFDKAQEKILKYGTEEQKVATLTDVINQSVKGMNEALGATPEGRIKQLSNNFAGLKASVGGLITNALQPVIRVLNIIVANLTIAINKANEFIKAFFKIKEAVGLGKAAAAGTEIVSDGIDGIGESAKKAAKAINSLGIDELNIATPDESGGGGGGSDGSEYGTAADEAEEGANRTIKALDAIIAKANELKDIFLTGFKFGLGDADFTKITDNIDRVKKSLKEIFISPDVLKSADAYADSVALSLGKITGSAASIGVTTATLLTGSIAGYLEQNSEFIKGKIVSILDASSRAHEISGNLAVALADIFTIFQSPAALQIGSDLIAIFANSFLSLIDLGVTFGADIIEAIARPIINNKDKIKKALENTLKPIETVVGGIKNFIGNAFSSIKKSYDTYIAPALDLFSNGFNTVFTSLLNSYNTYVAPVFQGIADKFSILLTEHLNPLITAFSNLAGEIVLAVAKIWDETLAPFIAWVIENLVPPFSAALGTIIDLFVDIAGVIADTIAGALKKLGEFVGWMGDNQGTIIKVTGVIAGFFAAWEAVKLASFIQQSGGVVSALGALLAPLASATTAILANAGAFLKNTAAKLADKAETIILTAMYAKDFVVSLASGTAALVKQAAQWVITTGMKAADTIATIASTAATTAATAATWLFNAALTVLTSPIALVVAAIAGLIAIGVLLYKNWDEIKEKALKVFEAIKVFIVKTFETIKTKTLEIWENIKDSITQTITNIKEKFEEIFGAVKTFVITIFTNIKEGIHDKITAIKDGLSGALDSIKEKWDNIWNNLKTTVIDIFSSIWTNIKGVINSILGGIEGMANGVVKGVNKVISALNNLSFDIPDWIPPPLGGKTFGFNIPSLGEISIPKLAQGGYVKANTPQLAMIGDNRHQGEVVAPEDKMLEMAVKAAELVNNKKDDSVYMPMIIELMNRIIDILEALDLNLELDGKSVLKGLKDTKKRMGFQF